MTNRFSSWRDSFPPIPPHKSPADKILSGAFGFKLEALRCRGEDDDDGEVILQYEISGTIDGSDDARELLAALLREFNSPAGGEASHA
jgi:hypothetical protein